MPSWARYSGKRGKGFFYVTNHKYYVDNNMVYFGKNTDYLVPLPSVGKKLKDVSIAEICALFKKN